jgi:hypothetical protein
VRNLNLPIPAELASKGVLRADCDQEEKCTSSSVADIGVSRDAISVRGALYMTSTAEIMNDESTPHNAVRSVGRIVFSMCSMVA